MKKAKFHEVAECIVDNHYGVYSAQVLNERVNLDISDEQKSILAAGPEHEEYIELWAELDNETCENGKYDIRQIDGDIWIVPSDVEITDWEEILM